MTTDTDKLISKTLPWRQRETAFNGLFQPQGDQIVVVVDGATPELAEQAAATLGMPVREPRKASDFVPRGFDFGVVLNAVKAGQHGHYHKYRYREYGAVTAEV